MSFLFHEPFEPALYTRERPFAAQPPPASRAFSVHRRAIAQLAAGEAFDEPFEAWRYRRRPGARPIVVAGAVTSFNPARRRLADAFFEAEPHAAPRRRFSAGHANPPPVHGAAFPAARRHIAMLAAWPEDPWPDVTRHLGGFGFTLPDGTSASFTLSFTGAGDDPYGDEALNAGAEALGADANQALATQRMADFTGVSAARRA